ncbi:MAG TPA: ATP-binding protein, partial [Ktedonobacteraceae bacterium]|nr:ATP-binding protein [Ktedonobacteraceae bacterium]
QTVKQIAPERRDLQLQVLSVFSTASSYLGRLYLFRDITKQNELERLKRDFVSQVSHELRTPLTSIKGFVSLLLEDSEHLDAEQQEFLSIVDENAHRLVRLVNDLLDLSRIEAGKIELNPTFFDLNELIDHTLQSFAPQLASKQQVLELHLQEPSPIIFADPARVQQILSNLVSNAHKYTLSGGTLCINTQLEGKEVWIQVQDSGVGMTPEEQAHLFTSFFRAKNHLTEDIGGTGLGLVITHSLVELHGGRMQVESQPGQGSTFRFTLPLPPKALHSRPPLPRQPGKKRLLVVEDNRDNAYLLQRLLERDGYEVLTASSGQEALDLASDEQPDLITLDLQLPDISGFTVFEQLKSNQKTAEIPILLLSVLDQEGRSRFLGPIEYVPKPFQEQDLLSSLHRLLSPTPASIFMFATSHEREDEWLKDSVQEQGYTLITATTTTHAQLLALIRQHRPSLILLDSEFPPDGGLAVFQALRSAPEKEIRELPVLVLGAREGTLSEQWARLERAGNNIQIIGRTCPLEEILEAITQQLAVGVRA